MSGRHVNCSFQKRPQPLYAPSFLGRINVLPSTAELCCVPEFAGTRHYPPSWVEATILAGSQWFWVGHSRESFAVGLLSDRGPGLVPGSRGYSTEPPAHRRGLGLPLRHSSPLPLFSEQSLRSSPLQDLQTILTLIVVFSVCPLSTAVVLRSRASLPKSATSPAAARGRSSAGDPEFPQYGADQTKPRRPILLIDGLTFATALRQPKALLGVSTLDTVPRPPRIWHAICTEKMRERAQGAGRTFTSNNT